MKVIITVEELFDRGVWMEACEMLGIGEYAVKEGFMDHDDEITLSKEQAIKLGFIKE